MRQKRKSEHGVALVTALGILTVVSLLAASAVVLSQYAERDSYTFSCFTRSSYVAEGAANRIYWFILNDRKKYPQRNIDNSDDSLQIDEERYLADGVPRQFEDYYGETIKYEIHDAVGGMDISGNMPQRELATLMNNLPEGSPDRKELEILGDRLQDYVDSDSLLKLNGMEKPEYLQQNLINLPRNRSMQYREEVLLIPGSETFFKPDGSGRLSSVRLIAPKGVSPIGGRPSLYSTPIPANRQPVSAVGFGDGQSGTSISGIFAQSHSIEKIPAAGISEKTGDVFRYCRIRFLHRSHRYLDGTATGAAVSSYFSLSVWQASAKDVL